MQKTDTALPQIGAAFEGGIYAGLTIHDNTPMALVLLAGDVEDKQWKDAITWAKDQGGELPSRFDALVLFTNLRSEFKDYDYWLATPDAGDDAAWCQDFDGGGQFYWHKDSELRARAVRRVII